MKYYKININNKEYSVAIAETTLGNEEVVSMPVNTAPQPVNKADEAKHVVSGKGVEVLAPMPGNVLSLKAKQGATVKKGEPIIILEAMKMENEIVATSDGKVDIFVNEGDKINSGDVIARIG